MKILPLHQIKNPKSIILDWDNTIVQSRHVLRKTIIDLADEIGFPHEKIKKSELFSHSFNRPVVEAFPELFEDKWQEAWKHYVRIMKKNRFQMMKLIEGALEFINLLSEDKIPMAIVSNKEEEFLHEEVKHFSIYDKFYNVISSGNNSKPNPEAAYRAFSPHLIPESEYDDCIWFIGDSSVDIECANNSKCAGILVGDTNYLNSNFHGKTGFIFKNFYELISFYKSLKN
ncbi:HAD family hydrolase [Lyticum sinuosum]|uniref:phosphoglycolate phosphatase n=1 Tax=Lyticum sinuosum TaxID=1332059 RepID=A0AAE5AH28_9RICK|nr:HAD-IA family hydrolase [Lyticum sinuosum]MDZ5761100.1 HAD family hydrolase [Lyticum sinuosum]